MSMDDIIIRRATPSDYEAVLDIHRNVYNGLDYMPTMYYEFLQSNKNVIYVAESVKDHKLTSMINFLLDEDGRKVYPLSERTRPEFQGRGLTLQLWKQLLADYPWITHAVYDGLLTKIGQKALADPNCCRHYVWNFIVYRISNNSLKSWSSSCKSVNSPTLTPVHLTHSAVDGLISSGRLERFLRQFATDYIPGVYPTWQAIPLTPLGLRSQLMLTSEIFVTYDQTFDLRSISFECPYALLTDRVKGHLASDVFFYGVNIDDFFRHVSCHLHHLAEVAGTGDVFLKLSFPLSLEMSAVERELESSSWPAILADLSAVKIRAYLASNAIFV